MKIIKLLGISNFKCFDDQSLELRPLSLLSGINGMGKSTVLQSLLLMRQSYLRSMETNFELDLNGGLVSIGVGKDALYQYADDDAIEFRIESDNKGKALWKWSCSETSGDVLPSIAHNVDDSIFDDGLFARDFQYLSAERIGPRAFFSTTRTHSSRLASFGVDGEFAPHFWSLHKGDLISNEVLQHPKEKSLQVSAQVNAWLNDISPGTVVDVQQYSDMDLVKMSYRFSGADVISNPYRATNVGYGLTHIFPILLALLTANKGTILLLENPEAHLHPAAQVMIGKLLASAASHGLQIIIESHSDHILNGIRVAVKDNHVTPSDVQLHFFERNLKEDKLLRRVISPKIDHNGRLDFWPQGFFDQWDRSLEDLIF